MRMVFKKSLIALLIIVFAFSPVSSLVKPAKASFLSDFGGDIAVTALGCTGLLDKATSLLSSLTGSLLGQVSQEVPVTDATTHSKESCLDTIAYTAAKIVLAKITQSTLNWINSGFQGSPTFVQNPGSFFASIANESLSSFTAQIAFDPSSYPFGRATAQNIIRSIQNQLDYNAQVSSGFLLNNDGDLTLPYAERFTNYTNDFLYGGGWDGYLAVTQITQANPFDSYINSVNTIGNTVNSAVSAKNPIAQVTNELQQSGGFLSLKKCVEPLDYEPESSDTTFTRAEATAQAKNDPNDSDTAAAVEWLRQHTCTRFETQTPGTAIAQQMNISLGESQKQLELADELNESISAVFDALIKQLFNKGVSSLGGQDSGSSNVNVLGGYGTNTSGTTLGGTTGSSSGDPDQWYNQNQNFDLKEAIAPGGVMDDPDCHFSYTIDPAGTIPSNTITGNIVDPDVVNSPDCNQGLAVLQKVYAEALISEAMKLQESILWINYADYCIPGPRPDWYSAASLAVSSLQERFNEIGNETDEDDRANDGYLELKYFTGFAADYEDTVNLRNTSDVYKAIWQALRESIGGPGYKEYIDDRYNPTSPQMPSITLLINQEYSKKTHYQNIIDQSQSAAAEAQAMYLRLQNIYNNVVAAETQYTPGSAAYQKYMDNQLRIFSRLVSELKSTEDITNITSDAALANDEIKYLADPTSGLIKLCIDETNNFGYNTNNQNVDYTRRPYGERKATTTDFNTWGWPSGDPLANYHPRLSFLPGFVITGSATGSGAGYIYIGHYVNECRSIRLDGFADYAGCGDGDTDLPNSTGDRFENHINSY